MDQTGNALLNLLRAAIQNEKPTDPELTPEGWEELLRLSDAHKLLPMVLDLSIGLPSCINALRRYPQEADSASVTLAKRWKEQVLMQVGRQAMQENEFLDLLLALQTRGLRPVILKGPVCRGLYPRPLLRPSVDDDLLIPETKAEAFHAALLELGLRADDPKADPAAAWELSYHKPNSPLYLELHKRLFDPTHPAFCGFNQWFEGALERAVPFRLQDVDTWTLAPTDHLLFLLLHAFKHFLFSGFGLRIVADICLFSRQYREEIDFSAVYHVCKSLRCERFAAAVYQIGGSRLDLPIPEPFAAEEVDDAPLLEDILASGLLGEQIERLHSANITLGAVTGAQQGKKRTGTLRNTLFPSVYTLTDDYPFLKDRPWLLPVAWTKRIWRYLRSRGREGDKSSAASLRIGRERIKLLQSYGVLDP